MHVFTKITDVEILKDLSNKFERNIPCFCYLSTVINHTEKINDLSKGIQEARKFGIQLVIIDDPNEQQRNEFKEKIDRYEVIDLYQVIEHNVLETW